MADGIRNFSRDTDAAIRLYMQHWIAKTELGFLLHPSVSVLQSKEFKVLDIACGTGLWLSDLARTLPDAQLHGFDLSSAHFPPQDELPHNVRLWQQDAAEPVSKDLLGQYDVIHVARLHMYIADQRMPQLMKNLKVLLKLGGYLHWDELDVLGMHAARFHGPKKFPEFIQMHEATNTWLNSQKVATWSLDDIPELLKPYGFRTIDHKRWEVSKTMSKPWTDMQLIANRDYIENAIIPLARSQGDESSIDRFRGLKQGVEREVKEEGLRILMDMVYTIARKED